MTDLNPNDDLARYYASLGIPDNAWHIGPEHPSLERLAIRLLSATKRARILEIGVQAGGFAVPVVLAMAHRRDFNYVGVDNREYTNAVPLSLIADYVRGRGVKEHVRLIEGDSTATLKSAAAASFDVILLDHYKPKYPFDLLLIFRRELLSNDGVIVVHDVLGHAAREWWICKRLCEVFGYAADVNTDVVQGVGLIRRSGEPSGQRIFTTLITVQITVLWALHAVALKSRRRVGRLLRACGLR